MKSEKLPFHPHGSLRAGYAKCYFAHLLYHFDCIVLQCFQPLCKWMLFQILSYLRLCLASSAGVPVFADIIHNLPEFNYPVISKYVGKILSQGNNKSVLHKYLNLNEQYLTALGGKLNQQLSIYATIKFHLKTYHFNSNNSFSTQARTTKYLDRQLKSSNFCEDPISPNFTFKNCFLAS